MSEGPVTEVWRTHPSPGAHEKVRIGRSGDVAWTQRLNVYSVGSRPKAHPHAE